jgi:hypothetical protein
MQPKANTTKSKVGQNKMGQGQGKEDRVGQCEVERDRGKAE